MTSCATHFNIPRDCGKNTNPTRRIFIDDLLEFIAIRLQEEAITGILYKLFIGPETVNDKQKSFPIQGSAHVTLKLVRLKTVPSSSQFYLGWPANGGTQNLTPLLPVIGDASVQYQLLQWGFKERPTCPREPGKVRGLCYSSHLGSADQANCDEPWRLVHGLLQCPERYLS